MSLALAKTPAETALGHALPHRRMEEWRWTDLRQLIDRPYLPRQAVAHDQADAKRLLASSPFAKIAKARIVFVNGVFDAGLSKTAGLDIVHGLPAAATGEPVAEMNAAFATDGVTLAITGNIDAPIEIIAIATKAAPRAIAIRNAIAVASGASATLIETHLGEGDYLVNAVSLITLGEGARLDRVKVEIESTEAIHLAHAGVTLAARSVLRDFTLTSGARLNRQNGAISFMGEHGDAKVNGSFLLSGRQHADTRLIVDHRVPHCTSRELFKCVMDDHARGIFQGKVIVQRDAQKTDGKQSSNALLLSETAEFDAKPELEIYADDVVCGHGATAGDLDENHMFYLASRGIPKAEARALLIAAFIDEAFDVISHEGVKDALAGFVEARIT